jgi:hypothetical protein
MLRASRFLTAALLLPAFGAAAQTAPAAPAAPDASVAKPAARREMVPPRATVLAPPDIARVECPVPGVSNGRAFYVDPQSGSPDGDGSKAHPWRTLAEVLSPRAGAKGKPAFGGGDTIYLLSGDHGAVSVTGRNSDFVTVRAAPGAKPVLQSLRVAGASKWVFDRLTIFGLRNTWAPLVSIGMAGTGPGLPANPADNITITNTLITSSDDDSQWTQEDWRTKPRYFGVKIDDGSKLGGVSCINLAHNHITNILFGVALMATNSRFTDNIIDYFGGDALDVGGSHLVIARNLFANNIEIGINNHNDAIQMQAGRYRTYRDIVIDGNTVLRQTRADIPFTSYLQGISAFNSDWFDVTVTNNVVVTNATHGISWGSTHGGLFANNIVLNDEAAAFNFRQSWLMISPRTHEGFDSNDVVARNNVTSNLVAKSTSPTVKFMSNITGFAVLQAGDRQVFYKMSGKIPGDNRVVGNIKKMFVDYEPLKYRFDLRPAQPRDAANWPNHLMAVVGGPKDGPQPGIQPE